MRCKVTNGYLEVGDIITIVSYDNDSRYLYKVTGFANYNGKSQVQFRKVIPETLEFFPETVGSWMSFEEAEKEIKIVRKKR